MAIKRRRRNRVLRELRAHLGLTQKELADRADLNPVFVCQVETGAEKLGPGGGLKILRAFGQQAREIGIDLDDLLRGKRAA